MSLPSTAFRTTLPVMFGYVPLGMAFGMLFQDLGYAWYFAPLMGLFVYAGAAQFMAVGLLTAHAGILEVGISTFILNSRHMFFGLAVLTRYRAKGLQKFYLIFALTDETYSLVTSTQPPPGVDTRRYYLMISAFNQSYWIAGCALGALLGSNVEFDTRGMDFALTALFLVLVLEQWKKLREPSPFILGLLTGIGALLLWPQHMLLISIGLSILLLLTRYQAKGGTA
ncbi:MAG: AzlC family ABC transporter permease [Candidatus Sedimenticola sp. 6PFRAG5]